MDKKNLIRLFSLVLVIVLAALVHSCRENEYRQMEIALDTVIEIRATAPSKMELEKVVNQAFRLIKQYEEKFSYYDEKSELSMFNQADKESMEIDADWFSILTLAEQVYAETDSLYDVTIGKLIDIWDFDEERIPQKEEILAAQQMTGFYQIEFDEKTLSKPFALHINLGSIAKGFIIEKVVEMLQENGVASGIINAGGDIRMFGQKKPLKIGIKHPRKEGNEIINILNIQHGAVVTTGDYERYFMKDGRRYHHIINPRSGYPSDTMLSITVTHPSSFIADAYATGLFLLPPAKAVAIAETIEDLEIVVYYQAENVIQQSQSSGMELYEK